MGLGLIEKCLLSSSSSSSSSIGASFTGDRDLSVSPSSYSADSSKISRSTFKPFKNSSS